MSKGDVAAGLEQAKEDLVANAVPAKSDTEKLTLFERLLDGEMKAEDFPEISIDFLSMKTVVKKQETVPFFSVFDIAEEPESKSWHCNLKIQSNYRSRGEFYINFWLELDTYHKHRNVQLYLQYAKVMFAEPLSWCFDSAARNANENVNSVVYKEFRDSYLSSKIPKRLVALVQQEKKIFDQILLVKEATWTVEKGEKAAPDPLIIGRKGEKFFLLHAFDETNIEHYVSKEFTQPTKKGR